jgi:hypothetical protein
MATQFPERVHYHSGGGGGDGVFGYIVVGLLILAIIVFVIVVAVRVSKMRREEAMKNSGQFPPAPNLPAQQGFSPPQPPQPYPPQQGFAPQQQGFPPSQPGYPPSQPMPQQQYAPQGPYGQRPPGPGAGPRSW